MKHKLWACAASRCGTRIAPSKVVTFILQTNGELAEHFGYASGFLADLPKVGVCTDEEAAEWKFQLRQAKDEASERLVDLD